MMSSFYLIVAVLFGAVALTIWIVFLRPVRQRTGRGTIVRRVRRREATYWQPHHGIGRGFRTPTPVPIAEAWVFEIDMEGGEGRVHHAMSRVAGAEFETGDEVLLTYERRGVPPIWMRTYVFRMENEDPRRFRG